MLADRLLAPVGQLGVVQVEMSLHEVTQVAAHPARGRLDRRAGLLHHGIAGALAVDPGDDVRARGGTDVDQEAVPALIGQLGERQVESGARAGARAHRRAEAGLTRLGAVHRDDECALAAGRVP